MCFAIPLKVKSTTKTQAVMEDGRHVNLSLIGACHSDDWLLVRSNLAVEKLSPFEARLIRQSLKLSAHES